MNPCLDAPLYPADSGECDRYAHPLAKLCPKCLAFRIGQIDGALLELDVRRQSLAVKREGLQHDLALGPPDLRPILLDELARLDSKRTELMHQLIALPYVPQEPQ